MEPKNEKNCFCGGYGTYTEYNCGVAYEVMCPHCQGSGVKACSCEKVSLVCVTFGRGHEVT